MVVTGAGASFDWALVQPEVAKFTRISTYDHSGVAWSDPGPKDTSALRVNELHTALTNSHNPAPYVLVGHSLGAFVARLYAARVASEVAGMVIVDHGLARPLHQPALIPVGQPLPGRLIQNPPQPPPGAPPNQSFEKLPEPYYNLHLWADSLPSTASVMRRNAEMAGECEAGLTSSLVLLCYK